MATSTRPAPQATKSKTLNINPGTYIFQLTQKITPLTKDSPPYPRKKQLPAVVEVFDEESGRTRLVRVVPGVREIFVDDQNEHRIDDARANTSAWVPEFKDGLLTLTSPADDAKIRRMLLDDKYDGKKQKADDSVTSVYTLINETANATEALSISKERKIATDRAWEAVEDMDSIEAHAKFLNISYKDGSRNKTEEEIKAEYIRKAETDPVNFNKYYKSPVIELRLLIKKAIDKNIIDLGHVRGQAHWSDTKALITEKIDLSKDALESLMVYATSDEGAEFKERLKELV